MRRFSQFTPYRVLFALSITTPIFLQEFRLGLLAKSLCFSIVVVGICLHWVYNRIL
ncbi:UNVERIFIED_CONTAM: urea ABC transporter permease subunit UrtC, partial [Bacillus subtilis]